MALPSSGPLTLNDIQTEFGGSNPIGLNEYYAGGSYVPSGTTGTNGAVPSSGVISLWNFYGTSSVNPNIGVTWTSYAQPGAYYNADYINSPSLFVLGGTAGYVYTSPNGSTWTQQLGLRATTWGVGTTTAYVYTFASNNSGTIYIGGYNGKGATTSDLITYTYQSSWGTVNTNLNCTACVWTGTNFLAFGQNGIVGTSPDGVTWTRSDALRALWGTASSASAKQNLYFMGRYYALAQTANKLAYTTDNGGTFTNTNLTSAIGSATNPGSIVCSSTILIATSQNGVFARSTDGINFTNISSAVTATGFPATSFARGSVWTGTKFVVFGDTASSATSPDGLTWTLQTGLATAWANTNSVNYSAFSAPLQKIIAVGSTSWGKVAVSP